MRWHSLISSGHFNQMQKNTPSSQVHVDYSACWTTSWVTNKTSVNLRKFKSHQASSLIQCHETRYQLQEKITVRNTNAWRLNNKFLNNQQVTEEIRREIKNF